MADCAPVMLWLAGTEGRCRYVNHRWLEFTGRSLEAELGDGWRQGIHTEDLAAVLESWREAFDGRLPYSANYRKLRSDGVYRWLHDSGSPQFDADGRFEGYVGVCLDETEERNTRQALELSEERMRTLLDTIPCHVYKLDQDGQLEYVNEHWLEYSGYTREEVLAGRGVGAHPEDSHSMRAAAKQGQDEGSPYTVEMRLRRRDGSYRWHMARTVPVTVNGRVVGWVGANVDIDDRKRREAVSEFLDDAGRVLSERLELDATLTRITELAVPRLADWCKIDLFDEEAGSRLVAFSNADPQRMAMAATARAQAGVPALQEPLHERVMRTGRSELIERAEPLIAALVEQRPELKAVLEPFDFKSSLIVAIRHRGRSLGALTLVTAESERRLDHHDLALAEAFAGRIAMAIENARLYDNLTESLKAKDAFLGLVSHELRTPLTTLKGTANVLRRHGDAISAGDRAQALIDIERGAEQLAVIVENMLTLAYVENRGAPELEPQLLRRIIEAIVADQCDQFPGHQVVLTAPESLLPVCANADYVRHILVNLLGNARKYSS
ncbi:MAG: PAS domain S-box protein, partial [Anaerolineaceae bacterium]